MDAFARVPAWLARSFRDNIHEVNREAGKLWNEFIVTSLQLFEDVQFREDIVRMYVEPTALDAAVEQYRQLDAIIQATSAEEFLTANPGFQTAAASDHLAGGITVNKFTVNIHPFVARLMAHITELDGDFLWNCPVQGLQRNFLGDVTKLDSRQGPLQADHFVLSPGVTGNVLLNGTLCEDLIHGVLGTWLQIPNLHPQVQHSTKIHRRGHLVEDISITVAKDVQTGEDILMFGGGYGYAGLDRPAPDNAELMALFNEFEEVARIYFPRGYADAKKRNSMYPGGTRKFCVRPFTLPSLGVFDKIPTASGGHLIITGGNNTGGFAQAPAVARAVLRALLGEHDPIHAFFHPDRGRLQTPITAVHTGTVTYKSRFPGLLSLRKTAARPPLKLLLLCSDGSQHSYLRYCLNRAFPGYRCIVKTGDGQVRQLVEKRRMVDAYYMKYHSLRRSISGHDHQRKAYFNRLMPQDHVSPAPDLTVDSLNCRKVWDAVEEW